MALTAAEVFRDYVTDGVPPSGPNKPKKSEIRTLLRQYEQVINAFTSNGGLIYSSKAAMDADLAHDANSSAWVVGDAVAANNGIYGKVGASGSGSWTRRADLPFSFIVASDAGAGTPNAIQATSSLPITSSALVLLNIFDDNTGSPVTVAFNGGDPLTVKTNTGNDVAAGGLLTGMLVMGRVSGSDFRLVSDQVSSAVVAAAEAAQAAAEAAQTAAEAAAAGVSLPPVAPNRMLVDNAAGTARESKTFAQVVDLLGLPPLLSPVLVYLSVAQVKTTSVAGTVKVLRVAGYDAEGDGGSAQWKRVAVAPPHGAGVRSVDRFLPNGTSDPTNGGWWDIDEAYPNELMFGGVASRTNAQQTAAIQSLMDYCAAASPKRTAHVIAGHTITALLIIPNYLHMRFVAGGGGGSGYPLLDKGFNGTMFAGGSGWTIENMALRGNAATYTGNGININSGSDQLLINPFIIDMEGPCLNFTTGGQGIRFRCDGGFLDRSQTPGVRYAVQMPATEATTTGFRTFYGVHTGGKPFVDFQNGNYTTLDGCVFAGINYGNTTTGRTKVINCRDANAGGVLVFGTEHYFAGNHYGGGMTIGAGATYCKFVGNIISGGGSVTNSSGNATNQVV